MIANKNNTVLLLKETPRERQGPFGGQYVHVVEDKAYYQMNKPQEVHYAIWNGEKYEKPHKNVTISNSLAAHNFRVFIDQNPDTPPEEKYKAVGGYHVGKGHGELKNCNISKDLPVVECFDPVWPEQRRFLFKDDFYHPRHANGMYIFVSADGLSWREYQKKPIFSILSSCLDQEGNKLPDGTIGFDYMPSVFFDTNINEYVIYLRANIALGCRSILYSHSKDLIEWSTPQLISCNPKFDTENKQNFYYPAVYPYGKKYVAFPPHFKNRILDKRGHRRLYEEEHTAVMLSNDRINWETKGKIFECETGRHLYQPHVVSFRKEGEKDVIYVHEGFQTPNGKLVRYEIDLEMITKQ